MITSDLYIPFKSQLQCDKTLCVWTEMEINFVSDFLSLPLGYLLTCLSPFAFYSPGSNSRALWQRGVFTRLELFQQSIYSTDSFYIWCCTEYELWRLMLANQWGNVLWTCPSQIRKLMPLEQDGEALMIIKSVEHRWSVIGGGGIGHLRKWLQFFCTDVGHEKSNIMIKGMWGNYRSSVDLIAATRKFEMLGDNRDVLQGNQILISNFRRRFLYVVCFLLGNSPASEFYMPTFRNTLSVPSL